MIAGLTGSKAPRANSSEIAVEGLRQARNLNDVEAIDFNALGTQVGSEGVKAPTKADDQMKVRAHTRRS